MNKHLRFSIICIAIIVISVALFNYYYQEYIKPKSYTLGEVVIKDYTALPIKDYLSENEVLFSQDLDDVSFKNVNGIGDKKFNEIRCRRADDCLY